MSLYTHGALPLPWLILSQANGRPAEDTREHGLTNLQIKTFATVTLCVDIWATGVQFLFTHTRIYRDTECFALVMAISVSHSVCNNNMTCKSLTVWYSDNKRIEKAAGNHREDSLSSVTLRFLFLVSG